MKIKRIKTYARRACSCWLLGLLVCTVFGEEATPPMQDLPEQIKPLYNKAMDAAAQKDWHRAAEGFAQTLLLSMTNRAARITKEIHYLTIEFNAAASYAKAGEELHSIAWYRAYLAGCSKWSDIEEPLPGKPAAVEKEIGRLTAITEKKICDILNAAVSVANTIQEPEEQIAALMELAMDKARAGDIDGALQLSANEVIPKKLKSWVRSLSYRTYAVTLAGKGNLSEAKTALQHVSKDHEEESRDAVWEEWSKYLADSGKSDAAIDAANKIKDVELREKAIDCVKKSNQDSLSEVEKRLGFALAKKEKWENLRNLPTLIEEASKGTTPRVIIKRLRDLAEPIGHGLSYLRLLDAQFSCQGKTEDTK